MHIRDIFAKQPTTFSFEFFPPRTDEGERTLWEAIRRLEPLGQLARAQVTEVVCSERGQQSEADVGGRGAVRDAQLGRLLHVVGR